MKAIVTLSHSLLGDSFAGKLSSKSPASICGMRCNSKIAELGHFWHLLDL